MEHELSMERDLTSENLEIAFETLNGFTAKIADLKESQEKAVVASLQIEITKHYLACFLAHKAQGMGEEEALIATVNGTLKLG